MKALKDLQYYHKGMHWASFELPVFLKSKLTSTRKNFVQAVKQ